MDEQLQLVSGLKKCMNVCDEEYLVRSSINFYLLIFSIGIHFKRNQFVALHDNFHKENQILHDVKEKDIYL